jgi:hypothetical protein
MELVQGEESINNALDRLQSAFDSLSNVLIENIGDKKKETLKSITEMTEDVVKRSFDGMSIMDPREMAKTTAELMKHSSDTMAGWVNRITTAEGEEPKPAADILA